MMAPARLGKSKGGARSAPRRTRAPRTRDPALLCLACWLFAVGFSASVEAASRAIAVASGGMVVVTEDGHAVSFGDPVHLKRPIRIVGGDDVVAVDRKPPLGVALHRDGRVSIWREHCEAKSDVDVECIFSVATRVPGLSGVKAISQGYGFTLALKSDGSVWGWGDDTYGQVSGRAGNPAGRRGIREPTRLPLPNPVHAISAGWRHALALLEDGRVVAWGTPPHRSLGPGKQITGAGGFTANEVAGLPPVSQVAARELSYALSADGRVWNWGVFDDSVHSFGQEPPRENGGEIRFTQVAAGHGYAVGRDARGGVFVWGALAAPDLARRGLDRIFSENPIRIEGLPAVRSVSVGEGMIAALDEDGHVWSWGRGIPGCCLRTIEIE